MSSDKVNKFLKCEGSFDNFITFYDQMEQTFNTSVKFMYNPNPDGCYH